MDVWVVGLDILVKQLSPQNAVTPRLGRVSPRNLGVSASRRCSNSATAISSLRNAIEVNKHGTLFYVLELEARVGARLILRQSIHTFLPILRAGSLGAR